MRGRSTVGLRNRPTRECLGASATGIYVGSRADSEAMNRFIAQHTIRPVVDRVFPFEDAATACDFMDNGSYLGKIVIRVGN